MNLYVKPDYIPKLMRYYIE